jgi:hypothetical protein
VKDERGGKLLGKGGPTLLKVPSMMEKNKKAEKDNLHEITYLKIREAEDKWECAYYHLDETVPQLKP